MSQASQYNLRRKRLNTLQMEQSENQPANPSAGIAPQTTTAVPTHDDGADSQSTNSIIPPALRSANTTPSDDDSTPNLHDDALATDQLIADELAPQVNDTESIYIAPMPIHDSRATTKTDNTDFDTILLYLQNMNTNLNEKLDKTKSELNANSNEKLDKTKSELNANLNEKLEKTNQNLNEKYEKLENTNQKLSQEIQTCTSVLETQINEIRQTQNEFQSQITAIKTTQDEQYHEMSVFKETVTQKIDRIQTEVKDVVDRNLDQHKNMIETRICENENRIIKTVTDQLTAHEQQTEEHFKLLIKQTKTDTETLTAIHTQALRNEIIPQIQHTDLLLREQNTKINHLTETITECRQEVQNFKSTQPNFSNLSGPIQIICSGNDSNDRQLPKFNGRAGNPNEYVQRLKRYYEKTLERQPNGNPTDILKDLLESSFEGPASRWLQLIKTDITTWEKFVEEFIAKYWSREVQRGIRSKIEAEQYRPQGNLSRTEYFTERVLLLQSITPQMSEEEIVILLSERFDNLIQDSRCVQNITTVRDFERLLQKEDIRDGPRRLRSNHSSHSNYSHNSTPSSPNSQRRSSPPQNQYNNQTQNYRAYQPYNHGNRNNGPSQQYRDHRRQEPQNHDRPHYNNYRQNNQHRHNFNPYRREPDNQRNGNNQRNHKPYPTTEQSQICTMIRQNNSPPTTPINSPPPNSDGNTTSTRSENSSAL